MDRPKDILSYNADRDYSLWWLIVQMRRAMHQVRKKELLKYNITPEEAAVLFAIDAIGHSATPAQISRWLLRKSHSISDQVKRMEAKGFVKKLKDLEKKNWIRVAMTDKGQEAFHNTLGRKTVHDILSCLSEEEHNQLKALVIKVRDKALDELKLDTRPPFPRI